MAVKKTREKKLYKRLFACLRPKSEIEIEMAERYCEWLEIYTTAKEIVDTEGTIKQGSNGVEYTSPHFNQMVMAEAEMRRLWKQLENSMVEPQDDTTDLGDFANL